MARPIAIFDIDGVLANCEHRLHYAKQKDYKTFYCDEEIMKDQPIPAGIELLEMMAERCDIHYVTGRSKSCTHATVSWSIKWLIPKVYERSILAMRNDGDYRPSPIVKVELIKELFDEIIARDEREGNLVTQDVRPTYFIDDDPENVKAVCKAYPNIVGITFGIKRMEEQC